MRLHRLEVTAFGPFTDTVVVDFDQLSDAGLFLLTGPTGAGKTSVLDAVCFGLYGVVPGDRATAGHLRSDQAAPDVVPRVELELSVGERRFRFTRSPAWERPKKRGTGTTSAHASVVAEELVAGSWQTLATRLDDVGLLVSDLLGMTATQFTQVAMLPQGRFQTFLRARSDERRAVLQRLFRTDRFEAVERWLVERRLELRREGQRAHHRAAAVLHRLAEASGQALPETWDPQELTAVADDGSVVAWAGEVTAGSSGALASATEASRAARAALTSAEADLAHAELVHRAQERGRVARASLVACASEGEATERRRAAVALHDRLAPVAELADRADASAVHAGRLRELAGRAGRAAARALRVDGILEPAELRALLVSDQQRRAVVAAFASREAELARLAVTREAALERRTVLGDEIAAAETELEILPGLVRDAELEQETVRAAAAGAGAAETRAASLRLAHQAATRVLVLTPQLDEAREVLRSVTDTVHALRDAYQEAREERITQMAAELAVGLAVGGSCPVCGSHEHPSPATHLGRRVGRAEEDAARKAYEDAGLERQVVEEKIRTLDTELRIAREAAGDATPPDLLGELRRAEGAAASAVQARDRLRGLTTALTGLRERLSSTEKARSDARAEHSALTATLDAATRQLTELEKERAEVLGSGSSVAALLDELDRRIDALDGAVRSGDDAREAGRAAEEAALAARAAAEKAGLDDLRALRSSLLSATVREDYVAAIAAYDERLAAARATLAEPEVARWLDLPAPDLDAARTARRTSAALAEETAGVQTAAKRRDTRVRALGAELDAALAAWAPIREQHATAARLAALCEGKGPDNPQRVSLSAYVLGERLRQVVAAANERLGAMTDQRYRLEHTDDRDAGETRGGLSLLVRDDWSGVRRDPATLSGGEMFLASLALALGLADTVSHEAGGTDIDTMFIDEGFGSLDSETLEDVMDTLDRLRDGGRVIGVVSHVAEMRTRITTQLEVRKGRGGSVAVPLLATG